MITTLRKAEPAARQARSRATGRLGRKVRRNASAHGFLIGAVLCFLFFSWYPMCREIIMSFQKTHLGVTSWAGWANYERIFHDPTFWVAWRNTLEFTVLALIIGYAVPFFLAILLNELRHAQGYLRCLVYLPVMLPGAAALRLLLRSDLRPVQRHPAHPAPADLAVGSVAGHHRADHGDDLGGDRGHLDEHGRRDADLSGRAAEHPG